VKSYKFKIRRPAKNVVEKFEQTLELCRELYNAGLQERREAWNFSRISINYFSQANQLSEIKETRKDLKTVHAQVLQDVLRRLDKSLKPFSIESKKAIKQVFRALKGKIAMIHSVFRKADLSSRRQIKTLENRLVQNSPEP
jgi:putative transposase